MQTTPIGLIFLWLVFGWAGPAAAWPVVIMTDTRGEYPLGHILEYLEDPESILTIADVRSPVHAGRFQTGRDQVPNFGFTPSTYWVRLRLYNLAPQTTEWLLEVRNSGIHQIEFYRAGPDVAEWNAAEWNMIRTGSAHPFDTRELPYHRFVFRVPLPTATEGIIYLRFQSRAPLILPLTLWSPEGFIRHSQHDFFLSGLFYGALLLLIAYNAFLWAVLRDHTYGWYVGVMSCVLMGQFVYEGLAVQYLWPEAPRWTGPTMLFFWIGVSIFVQMFTLTILDTRSRAPRCHRAIIGFLALWCLLVVLIPFADYRTLSRVVMPLRIINILFFIGVNLLIWRRGYPPARYILLAWLSSGLSTILFVLVRTGWVPSIPILDQGYKIGIVLTGLLFSYALADRVQTLRREKDAVRDQLFMALTADQAKTRFLSTMSHELRIPLTAILGYAQLLREGSRPGSPEYKGLETIERGGCHLVQLTDDLMDLARVETGKLELTRAPFALPNCLAGVSDMVGLRAEQKGLIFEYGPHPDLPEMVLGDEKRLTQVLLNLLGNAVKFTAQGRVTLTVTPVMADDTSGGPPSGSSGRAWRFRVADTGPGIPANRLADIFTPFVQLADSGGQHEGIGLGLPISRHLVQVMGATLDVRSTPGVGSEFAFTIHLPEMPGDGVSSRTRSRESLVTGGRAAQPPLQWPPNEELQALRHLAERRAFTELAETLTRLSETHACYAPVADHLLQLLEQFEFTAIINQLDEAFHRKEQA